MSRNYASAHRTTSRDYTVARRRLLAAVGAGAAAGLAGCTGAADPDSTDTPTPSGGDAIDPQFGFVGTSADTPAPVEPDHEVRLLIGAREGAPIPEFYFEPTGLYVDAGAVVKFVLATPDHTVTAYHSSLGRTQRVPDGVPALSSPVLGGGTYWLCRFDASGVYDLYCAPHEPFGMATRIVAGEVDGPGADPVSTEQPGHGDPRPPFQTAATVLGDAALAPDDIVDRGRVAWTDLDPESKRLQG